MESQLANIRMMELLENWDPLGYGEGSYETENVDVIQAVYQIDDLKKLGQKIQSIYEFSFEEIISHSACERMAEQLLLIKNNTSCEI